MSNSAFTPITYPAVGFSRAAGTSSAQARGYAAGYAEGLRRAATEHLAAEAARESEHRSSLAEGRTAIRHALAALGAAADQTRAAALPLIQEVEGALIEAALDLAEAVLQREVAAGHLDAADALRRVLAGAPEDELVAVRLHPADAAVAADADETTVQLIPDASLSRGDAVAVLRDGWLDARISAALSRARNVLEAGHA